VYGVCEDVGGVDLFLNGLDGGAGVQGFAGAVGVEGDLSDGFSAAGALLGTHLVVWTLDGIDPNVRKLAVDVADDGFGEQAADVGDG
jgi:hypothetical protein